MSAAATWKTMNAPIQANNIKSARARKTKRHQKFPPTLGILARFSSDYLECFN